MPKPVFPLGFPLGCDANAIERSPTRGEYGAGVKATLAAKPCLGLAEGLPGTGDTCPDNPSTNSIIRSASAAGIGKGHQFWVTKGRIGDPNNPVGGSRRGDTP